MNIIPHAASLRFSLNGETHLPSTKSAKLKEKKTFSFARKVPLDLWRDTTRGASSVKPAKERPLLVRSAKRETPAVLELR